MSETMNQEAEEEKKHKIKSRWPNFGRQEE